MNLYAVFFVDPTNWYCIQLPEKKEFTGSESREERKTEWWNKNPLISFVREAGESRIPWAERKELKGKCCKKEKKKKKKERKEKCQLFKDFESLPWEKVLYILIYSLKSCDLYHESTPTKKNPKKTYAFLEFSSPSSHPPPCRSGLCLLFPESSVTASVEEEVSKELGVEGCSWLAVPFPESLSTGEMTSDEEQDMSKAFERVL